MDDWEYKRVCITTDGPHPVSVKAWVHGWVAVRKTDRIATAHRHGPWVAFYVVNGLVFAAADSREEAQAVALAFKPHLRQLTEDFMQLVWAHQRDGVLPTPLREREYA